MFFSLFFTCYNVDVTWLDEIAEGLKNLTRSLNGVILNLMSIIWEKDPGAVKMKNDKLVIYLRSVLRQVSYSIGWVAGRLIKKEKVSDDEVTLNKLNILQGGIENRFIPGLSQATKIQIEGSFKITGDKELQKLALTEASQIQRTEEDQFLSDIISGSDSVSLALQVLHQALLTKIPMCAFARIGGESGMQISRAAYAVILKFTEKIFNFEAFCDNVKLMAVDI